jgi:hypothetical protein
MSISLFRKKFEKEPMTTPKESDIGYIKPDSTNAYTTISCIPAQSIENQIYRAYCINKSAGLKFLLSKVNILFKIKLHVMDIPIPKLKHKYTTY